MFSNSELFSNKGIFHFALKLFIKCCIYLSLIILLLEFSHSLIFLNWKGHFIPFLDISSCKNYFPILSKSFLLTKELILISVSSASAFFCCCCCPGNMLKKLSGIQKFLEISIMLYGYINGIVNFLGSI